MARPTKSAIDAEILDKAAGLFARHGFARTSLQQIADALGYSKAGLLHHYASKQALYDAVLNRYESETKARIIDFSKHPTGIERDRAMIENAIEHSFNWPGMSAFGHHLAREGDDPRYAQLGLLLIGALDIDFADLDAERVVRAFSALSGVSFTAALAVSMKLEGDWKRHILETAMDALGYREFGGAGRAS